MRLLSTADNSVVQVQRNTPGYAGGISFVVSYLS